jgi:hypothetical protein
MIKDSQLLLKPVKKKLKKKKSSLSHTSISAKSHLAISNIQKGMDKR